MAHLSFGPVALLGSGETAPASGPVYDMLAQRAPAPIQIAILETPAGFQPNSRRVAERVAEFIQTRLQNYAPAINLVAARKRGTSASPDDPAIAAQLLDADILFLGPGSPTYTVRQLADSATYQHLVARHRVGASVVAASAATIALGRYALPVYELFKVGEDVHWQPGLDFFAPFGLSLTLIPHWNNTEGGSELDTSHCYVGSERFAQLRTLLPDDTTIVGIDEHTACVLDLDAGTAQVRGRGSVTIIRPDETLTLARNESCPLSAFGPFRLPAREDGIAAAVWAAAVAAAEARTPASDTPAIPDAVTALLGERQAARARRDWAAADAIRDTLAAQGWAIRDTPAGAVLEPLKPAQVQ